MAEMCLPLIYLLPRYSLVFSAPFGSYGWAVVYNIIIMGGITGVVRAYAGTGLVGLILSNHTFEDALLKVLEIMDFFGIHPRAHDASR